MPKFSPIVRFSRHIFIIHSLNRMCLNICKVLLVKYLHLKETSSSCKDRTLPENLHQIKLLLLKYIQRQSIVIKFAFKLNGITMKFYSDLLIWRFLLSGCCVVLIVIMIIVTVCLIMVIIIITKPSKEDKCVVTVELI